MGNIIVIFKYFSTLQFPYIAITIAYLLQALKQQYLDDAPCISAPPTYPPQPPACRFLPYIWKGEKYLLSTYHQPSSLMNPTIPIITIQYVYELSF